MAVSKDPGLAIIETSRLLLREFVLEDAPMLYLLNSKQEVLRYTGDVPFASMREARDFLMKYEDYQKYGFGRWAIERRDSGEFIGWCGFKQHAEYVDLGFRLFQSYWGKGFATEAAKASLDYGFNNLGFSGVVGRVARQNVASVRVLEKLGMKFWKVDECDGIKDALFYKTMKS